MRLFQKNGYWITGCGACGHRMAEISPEAEHVDQVYGDHYFQGDVDGYPDYLSEAALLTAAGKRYGESLKTYLHAGTVLDVGCAAGFLLKGFQDVGWKVGGIEPNRTMSGHASRLLGIQVETVPLEDYRSDTQFDVITMIQVLPHFYDLNAALRAATKVTRPAGYWLIETWNRDSIAARIFGQNWHEYSPPSVLHYFSKTGLIRLVGEYGFIPVAQGRPAKRLIGQHAKSIIKHNSPAGSLGRLVIAGMDLIPDGLALPYPAFDLFWILFQKGV